MKNYRIYFALLLTCLIYTTNVSADVKVKSRQAAGGQTSENTTYIKGQRQRTEQNPGGIQMVQLTQCDLKRSVQLNDRMKTYIISAFEQNLSAIQNPQSEMVNDGVVRSGGTVTSTVTYKDTGETRKMFGYTARHILTTMETISTPDACLIIDSKMEIDGWYIDADFALDCENAKYTAGFNTSRESGCQDKYQTKTIGNSKRGFPVYEKMAMFDQNGNELAATVSEVVEFSQATLDKALFEIPADYREVRDAAAMYSGGLSMNSGSSDLSSGSNDSNEDSGTIRNIRNQAQTVEPSSNIEANKTGVTRIGIIVKTGAVGEGLNPGEMSAAVQNTLGEYLKGTNIELVPLEAKIASAIENEAREKECDFILYANVSHKKGGGGGLGIFGKVIAPAIGQTGIGHTGGTAGNIAGQVATRAIVSAGSVAGNTKAKDEIMIDIKLQNGAGAVFSKQYKARARSNGEDILSPMIEAIAGAVVANAK